MRTTINVSDSVIKEAESLYGTDNRSQAVEMALKDAIRIKKIQKLKELRGKIEFYDNYPAGVREAELDEDK